MTRGEIHLTRCSEAITLGGLGVRRLVERNVELLSKWWWRFGEEREHHGEGSLPTKPFNAISA